MRFRYAISEPAAARLAAAHQLSLLPADLRSHISHITPVRVSKAIERMMSPR